MALHPKYIVDQKGKKVAVVLPIKEYEELLDEIESDPEFIKAIDEGIESIERGETVPFEKVFGDVMRKGRK